MNFKPMLTKTLINTAIVLSFASAISTQVNAATVVNGDHVVDGSQCVGIDCSSSPSFGFDTLRLKENNLRIKFDDTSSSGSFPNNDWQITANDSSNGGANKFSIDDVTSGKTPFTVEAGAPSHTLYVASEGRIGIGTSTPAVNAHIVEGNSPTLRLEQDGSSGFSSQTWDIAGNETNFFIRDVTNGSLLPFRIKPGASKNSIFIAADGDVGLETETPDGQFDVAHYASANNHAFLISPTSSVGVNIDNGQLPYGLFDVQTTGGVSRFNVTSVGNVGVGTASPAGRFEVKDIDNTASYFDVDASGDIGIGTDTPDFSLEVERTGTGAIVAVTRTDGAQAALSASGNYGIVGTKSDHPFRLRVNNLEVMTLNADKSVDMGTGASHTAGGVWVDASSREYKDNIKELESERALKAFKELTPVTYNYKVNQKEGHVGFIAEDVPELVAQNDRKGLNAMNIVALLTKVVQEQQKTITKIENEVGEMRSRSAKLQVK